MWQNLGTYDQLFRSFLIGDMFAVTVGVGYGASWLITSRTIKYLRELLRGKNGM